MKYKIPLIILSLILIVTGGCESENTVSYTAKSSDTTLLNTDITKAEETTSEPTSVVSTETQTTNKTTRVTIQPESEIVRIINDIRLKNNFKPLVLTDQLCRIAEIRAEESSQLWSHTRPDGSKFDSLINAFGVEWSIIGENLARYDNASAQNVVDSWMNSNTHRDNILNARFRKCGIGYYLNENKTYVALIFSD